MSELSPILALSSRHTYAHMLTPPYHFSIVACPAPSQIQDDTKAPAQILYRGSIPATRNLPFLKRLGLKTVIYGKKKQLKDDDVLSRWSKKRGIDLRWVKAEGMGEEKLGMGKNEISDVLKIILNPESYPLYIADMDGISHTTLIIACLRKLQGWHLDSIINEIARFEPEYEDLPLIAFINAYLIPSSTSDTPFILPPPPYPTWLWPTGPGIPPPARPAHTTTRERTISAGNTPPNTVLPFPHPLTARKHPTMKLTFPTAPPTMAQGGSTNGAPSSAQSPQLAAQNPNVTLSRVNSIRSSAIKSPEPELPGLVGAASSLISNGLSRVASAVGGLDPQNKRLSRNVSFEHDDSYLEWKAAAIGATSPETLSRQATNVSSEEISESTEDGLVEVDPDDEEMEEDEDEDDEEDEEDEEDEDVQPPSQYISALDLAGF